MPLNADQLDAFWTIVQTGSFHRAAETLFITQSAVTQRIQALEGALGAKLFIRTGRRVNLTEAGRSVSRYCQQQRQAEADMLHLLRQETSGFVGDLTVVCDAAEWRAWLLNLLADLGRSHPGLNLTLAIDEAIDPAAMVLSCKADLVIGERPLRQRGLQSGLIGHLAYGLVIAPSLAAAWPDAPSWEQLAAVHGIDFAPQDRVLLDQLALCLPGIEPVGLRCHYINATTGLITWAVAGGGYAAVPLHHVAAELRDGRLRRLFPDVTMRRPLYWSSLVGMTSPATTAAVTMLKQYLPGELPV